MATINITSPDQVKWTRLSASFPTVDVAKEAVGLLLELGAQVKYQESVTNSAASEKARHRKDIKAKAFELALAEGGNPLDYLAKACAVVLDKDPSKAGEYSTEWFMTNIGLGKGS